MEISEHRVKKISFSKQKEYKTEKGRVFYSRGLTITNEQGEKSELTLYSNDKKGLSVEVLK